MSAVHAEVAIAERRPAMGEFIVIIAMMMAMTALSIDIMLPAFPAMRDYFGLNDANAVQLVITWYVLGFAGGQILYGPLSDRYGRKPVLLVGLIVYALGSVVTFLAPDFESLLIARAVQGVGCAAPRVIAIAMVRDMFGGRRMARVMSFVMMIFIMVPVIAPSIGEGLLLFGQWQWIFLFLLTVSLLLMLFTQLRLPETRASEDREPLSLAWLVKAFATTVGTRQTLGYTLATGFVFGCLMGYINSAQQILGSLYGLGSYFPLVFGIITIALALAAMTNGRLVERVGMRRLSHAALVGFFAVAVIHVVIAVSMPGPPPLVVFCGLLALDLFCFGFIMPNFNAMAMEPLQRIAGTASSFVGCLTTGGAALFGWVIGQQYDGTVLPLTGGYAILSAVALVIVLVTEKGKLFQSLHGEASP